MFNPFYPFQERLFAPMVQRGNQFFVLESYARCNGFMLMHYHDFGMAQQHYNSLSNDSVSKLYQWSNASDQIELKQLVNNNRVFAFLKIPDAEKVAKKMLDKRVRAYIANNTSWNPMGDDDVDFDIDFILGEVYIVLNYNTQSKKVKLEQLENI